MNSIDREFMESVYDVVRLIPPGRATSYGAIAKAIGRPGMSRAVGRVMGNCGSLAVGVPAHRVVNSCGVLSGSMAFGSPHRMRELLENEGVVVTGNRITEWKKVFWDPIDEIVL